MRQNGPEVGGDGVASRPHRFLCILEALSARCLAMVDYLSVIVAAVAAFAVGALWYGPLFGRPWRLLMNYSEGHAGTPSGGQGMSMPFAMGGGFIATLVLVYVLAVFMQALGIATASEAVSFGFTVSVGFIATTMMNSVFYERRPWKLYLINASHYVVAVIVASLVLFYV